MPRFETLQAIEKAISPAVLAERLETHIHTNDAGWATNCPACRCEMQVRRDGFVCSGELCTFAQGGVMDFAALVLGGYTKAAHWMFDKFGSEFPPLYRQTRVHFEDELAKESRKRRRWFEWYALARHRQRSKTTLAVADLRFQAYLHYGLEKDNASWEMLVASPKELTALDALYGGGLPNWLRGNQNALVSAWFAGPGRIAYFTFPRKDDAAFHIEVCPSLVNFLGLPTPDDEGAFLVTDQNQLMVDARALIPQPGELDLRACTLVRKIAEPTDFDIWYDLKFLLRPGMSASVPGSIARYMRSLNCLAWTRNGPENTWLTWEAHVQREVVRLCEGRVEPPAELKHFLREAAPDKAQQGRLIAALRYRGMHAQAEVLSATLSGFPILETQRLRILETTVGYQAFTIGQSSSIPSILSNFTVDVLRTAVFPVQGLVMHELEASMPGRKARCLVLPVALDNPDKLMTSVQLADAKANGECPGTPMVHDKRTMRLLTPHFRACAAQSERVRGLDLVGWDPTRTRFFAPNFHVGDVLRCDQTIVHPTLAALDIFVAGHGTVADKPDQVPQTPECGNILAQLAGVIYRGMTGRPQKAVVIKTHPSTLPAWDKLAQAAGQRGLLRLRPSERQHSRETVNGWPLLMLADEDASVPQGTGGLVVQAQAANPPIQPSDEMIAWLQWMLQRVPLMLLRAPVALQETVALTHENALIREGVACFAAAGVEKWPHQLTRFPILEKLLDVSKNEAGVLNAEYHMTPQLIALPLRDFTYDRTFLLVEAKTATNAHATLRDDKLWLPALEGQQFLNDLLGESLVRLQVVHNSDGEDTTNMPAAAQN